MADGGRASGRHGAPPVAPRRRGRAAVGGQPERRVTHGGRYGGHAAAAAAAARAAARRAGQHVLHDQRSARHNRRHVLPELRVHTAHNDVRALFHRPVASQKVTDFVQN